MPFPAAGYCAAFSRPPLSLARGRRPWRSFRRSTTSGESRGMVVRTREQPRNDRPARTNPPGRTRGSSCAASSASRHPLSGEQFRITAGRLRSPPCTIIGRSDKLGPAHHGVIRLTETRLLLSFPRVIYIKSAWRVLIVIVEDGPRGSQRLIAAPAGMCRSAVAIRRYLQRHGALFSP